MEDIGYPDFKFIANNIVDRYELVSALKDAYLAGHLAGYREGFRNGYLDTTQEPEEHA